MNSQDILISDISNVQTGKFDAACKQILAHKIILAHIMQSCIEEYADVPVERIMSEFIEGEPEIAVVPVMPHETNGELQENKQSLPKIHGDNTEDTSVNEGKVTYDILFHAFLPKDKELVKIFINVEAQAHNQSLGYPIIKRAIYYCSRLISSQYGREFTNAEYQHIKKVYSIWICVDEPQDKANTINRYSIKEENLLGAYQRNPENYDLLNIIILNTVKQDIAKMEKGIIKFLSAILSKKLAYSEKIAILQNDFDIINNDNVDREVDHMCNLGESLRAEAMAEGIVVGSAKGENRALILAKKLIACGRIDDLDKAENNPEYRAQLFKEFAIN